MNIKIIVPFYNVENTIQKTINSLMNQTVNDFSCTLINDCSTDKSQIIIEELIANDRRFRLLNNINNNGSAIQNIVKGLNFSNPDDDDLCVLIDGDDWLITNEALKKILNIYESNNVNLTYGHYITFPDGETNIALDLPNWVKDLGLYRCVYPFFLAPLRSFKGSLWKKVDTQWFKDKDGNYFTSATDAALMFSLAELSDGKIHCISEILYCYNRSRNLHVDKIRPTHQSNSMKEIRAMKSTCMQQLTDVQRWNKLSVEQFDELLEIEKIVMESFDKVGKSFFKEPFNYKKHSEIYKIKHQLFEKSMS